MNNLLVMDTNNTIKQEFNTTWPIVPSFLVKSVIHNGDTYSPNQHGIYDADTVRGLLADASDDENIQNPLSLFQVVPESCKFDKVSYIGEINQAGDDYFLNTILNGKKVVRIDPNFLYKNKTCCDRFRECNGCENKCHEQDCRIALLYHDNLKEVHYNNDFKIYYNKLNRIICEYNQGISEEYQLHCEQDEANKRLYVWYKCPYSNFIEYFFPIIHSGKVIAVLMQGQRIPNTLSKKEIFKDVLKDSTIDPRTREKLRKSIMEISRYEFGMETMNWTRLGAIWKRIHILEKRIDKEIMAYSKAYVSDNFHRIESDFHQKIKNTIKEEGKLTDCGYKEIVNEVLDEICNVFNEKGFIHIYSTEAKFEEVNSSTDTFYLIGTSYELTRIRQKRLEKIEFHNLPSNLDKIKNEGLHPYLIRKFNFSNNETFSVESLAIGNVKHLIWEYHPQKNSIYKKQINEYSNFLKTFYHMLWEPYNLLRSEILRKDLETSMRVSVHETAQIIPIIIDTLKKEYKLDFKFLIEEDRLDKYGITRRENTLYDTINRLYLLDNLYKRSTLMFKELLPKADWTDLHKLIYSVRSLCNEKARGDNMQKIVVEGLDGFKFHLYKIFTDYQLVSHTLFNLVDNAIKYGYMRSRININLSLSTNDLQNEQKGYLNEIKAVQIAVISYGEEVTKEDEKHLYELFYRSPALSKKKDGMGIGLFLVKKICASLGYTIEFKSTRLSEYNLPAYHYGAEYRKNKSLKTVSPTILKEAVNENIPEKDWHIEKSEFDAAINLPTHKNEFIITLNKINGNLIKENQL